MTNQAARLSTITIVERLFNFIRDNFDGFEHKPNPPQKWWHNHKFGEGSIIDNDNNYTTLKSFLVKKRFGKKLTNASVEKNNNPDEKWIIILIAPDNDKLPTEIRFHCYEWMSDNNNYLLKEIIFFNWNEIPKNNEQTLMQFLSEKFYVDWLKSVQIETDGKTIRAGGKEKSLLLQLNDEQNNVKLTIGDNIENFPAKFENNRLNIYKDYSFKVKKDSNGLVKKCSNSSQN